MRALSTAQACFVEKDLALVEATAGLSYATVDVKMPGNHVWWSPQLVGLTISQL